MVWRRKRSWSRRTMVRFFWSSTLHPPPSSFSLSRCIDRSADFWEGCRVFEKREADNLCLPSGSPNLPNPTSYFSRTSALTFSPCFVYSRKMQDFPPSGLKQRTGQVDRRPGEGRCPSCPRKKDRQGMLEWSVFSSQVRPSACPKA